MRKQIFALSMISMSVPTFAADDEQVLMTEFRQEVMAVIEKNLYSVEIDEIDVFAENGVVELKGYAFVGPEIDALTTKLKQLDSVKIVRNKLRSPFGHK